MRFDHPLLEGRLVKRYKRFLADVIVQRDGSPETVTAHCANPGSMMGLADPGATVWLQPNPNPKAKLDWRWELTDCGSSLVCINTARANQVVAEALEARTVRELSDYETVRPEVPYGEGSRVDFLLGKDGAPDAYLEVKSVTLSRDSAAAHRAAEFPDARTARGTKHLNDLLQVRAAGDRAVMLFLVQRMDCSLFRPAADIDPVYAETLRRAQDGGVELLCYASDVTREGLRLGSPLPVSLV